MTLAAFRSASCPGLMAMASCKVVGRARSQRMAQAARRRAGPRLGSSAAGDYLHRRRVQADLAGHVQHAAPGGGLRVRADACGRPR